jgi:putative ABC transport system ATP-binding protein
MSEIIKTSKISKIYQMGTQRVDALQSISIRIDKGEYVAFMGPSGSGKSTLMNIVGCLDTPTDGTYILNDKDVSHMTENELADVRNKEIGFVFQTFNLLPRASALENVALPLIYAGYGKYDRQEKAMEVLESVGLADRADHKPNELSGGQRQRVAIARALVNDPSIILADEPTGNLDSKTSYDIMDLFHDLHESGNTIIMVTHEDDIAHYAHRIVRLRDGLVETDKVNAEIYTSNKIRQTVLMKIYTKTGDPGVTSLLGGTRVLKSDRRIETYGTVDELNSFIGLIADLDPDKERTALLRNIQSRMFTIGSSLAAENDRAKDFKPDLEESDITQLETAIDEMNTVLPSMTNFIIPGGHQLISTTHVARTVCRRAERRVIELAASADVEEIVVRYLNRLSDFLFVLARKQGFDMGIDEVPWKPKR